jgi:hypothetical protein
VIVICRSSGITICGATLRKRNVGISLARMGRWKSTMRELSAEARLHLLARSLRRNGAGVHLAAVYGAFAVIAAVVFGTLSVHPF